MNKNVIIKHFHGYHDNVNCKICFLNTQDTFIDKINQQTEHFILTICNCPGTKYLNEVQYCNVNCFPRISHNNEPRNVYSIKEAEIHLSWEYLLTYKSYVS